MMGPFLPSLPKARIMPLTLFVCTSDFPWKSSGRNVVPSTTRLPHLLHLLLSRLLPVTSRAQAGECRPWPADSPR